MSFVVVAFLAFALSISWVAGEKEKDFLTDSLKETNYINTTISEQVRQAKGKAATDAKKMGTLNDRLTKLSKEKRKLEVKLRRTKMKRAALLKPQVARLKKKIEAQLEKEFLEEVTQLEKDLKSNARKLASLKKENEELKRAYEKIKKGGGGASLTPGRDIIDATKESTGLTAPVAPKESLTGAANATKPPIEEKPSVSIPSGKDESLMPEAASPAESVEGNGLRKIKLKEGWL